jgi:hypothetical protein
MGEWTREEIESHEQWQAGRLDGHFCNDWDGLAVNAWTYEYDCCTDFKKTWRGRIINRFVMWRFNFGWWWYIGRHPQKQVDWLAEIAAETKKSVDKKTDS